MNEVLPPTMTLAEVRSEIDAIDDAILDLLARRFACVAHVKSIKQTIAQSESPLRPAREAQVVARLALRARKAGLDSRLPALLWPLVFAEADLLQADIRIILAAGLVDNVAAARIIQARFGRIPVEPGGAEAGLLASVADHHGRLAILAAGSPWLEPYLAGRAGKARPLAALRYGPDSNDRLLVIGHAPVESTGKDETLLISKGSLPREFALRPVWSASSGAYRISALPGFLSEREAPLLGIIRSNAALGLKVVARFPAGLETL